MELRWWPVVVAGLVCLAVCVTLAALLPMPQVRRRLRPLAHVDRLTRLPEYARVVRLQFWSMLGLVALLVVLFLEALLASSRPAGFSFADYDADAAHAEDIMLCVGEPVTDPATAGFLDYFAERVPHFDTQRIGLTSPSLRVVPLTRDYQFAADQFSRYAKLASLQQNLDAKNPMPAVQMTELRAGIEDFSRPLRYVDYARSVEDVLALCMAGFPSSNDKAAHRRSLIYLGPSNIRDADEQRGALFSDQQLHDTAAAAGVQINVISRSDARAATNLDAIAAGTGGRFETYDAAGADDRQLVAMLDGIRAHPPAVVGAGATTITRPGDYPNVPLVAGVFVAALLCVALAVVRR